MTRRSSTRLAPGWLLGRCGSIEAQASSDSQNKVIPHLLIHSPVNQKSQINSSV